MTSDKIFVIVAVIHLLIREWPFGNTMQTILDILFLIVTFLLIAKYLGHTKGN